MACRSSVEAAAAGFWESCSDDEAGRPFSLPPVRGGGESRASGERPGIIGRGGMGGRMARRLTTAGYDLTVTNRSRQRLLPLQQAGAKAAATPREAAAAADVVLSCVADDQALEEVMLGPAGALSAPRPGTL